MKQYARKRILKSNMIKYEEEHKKCKLISVFVNWFGSTGCDQYFWQLGIVLGQSLLILVNFRRVKCS